jgi:hypothetical protein
MFQSRWNLHDLLLTIEATLASYGVALYDAPIEVASIALPAQRRAPQSPLLPRFPKLAPDNRMLEPCPLTLGLTNQPSEIGICLLHFGR